MLMLQFDQVNDTMKMTVKPVFYQKPHSRWVNFVYPTRRNLHKQHEMYMANANQTCVPNANYIPLVRVGGRVGCAGLCVGCAGLRGGCARVWGFVLGYTPNTKPQHKWFCIAVEYRLFS